LSPHHTLGHQSTFACRSYPRSPKGGGGLVVAANNQTARVLSALQAGQLRWASEELYQPRWQLQVSKAAGEIEQTKADCGHRMED
jgi:hypothetical protein